MHESAATRWAHVVEEADRSAPCPRRVALTNGETFDRYCTKGSGSDPERGLPPLRAPWIEGRGDTWSAEDEEAFRAPIREQYEHQGSPYYSTARLWDDGVIDPKDTRRALGLALDVCARAPMEDVGYGVFRM